MAITQIPFQTKPKMWNNTDTTRHYLAIYSMNRRTGKFSLWSLARLRLLVAKPIFLVPVIHHDGPDDKEILQRNGSSSHESFLFIAAAP